MKIDFVIPHLNYSGLKKTLASIRRNTSPENIGSIILIDQNKEYQKVDDLVDLHIYTNGVNLGFAKAVNMGIRLSDAKYVSCWNDDCECINKKWVEGIKETFDRYETALGVNPSSPRNPRASGAEPVDEWEYKEDFSDEEYDKLVKEHGKGHIIDGICTWATIFDREKLEKVAGVIPGKCWYDEYFYPGGGEDYSLNRQAYMTKNSDNKMRGYRMLGTGLSYVWHWWYKTKKEDGKEGVKYAGDLWHKKWGIMGEGNPDIFGRTGKQLVPMNTIRALEDCK